MLNEISKITFDGIREAAADGESITIIINGEFYDLATAAPAGNDPESAFIDGMLFSAALIEDARARADFLFDAISRRENTTKKACQINAARNEEITAAADLIRHISDIEKCSFSAWREEYNRGELWKIKREGGAV